MIKIEPALDYYAAHPNLTICVGLRADEEGRMGIEGTTHTVRYPLREWNWGEKEVVDYCKRRGFEPPPRTDCAVCFFQTLHEWYTLWRDHPEMYAQGVVWETVTGHTFRSPQRDTQPAALVDLAEKFKAGYVPKPRRRKVTCRVCEK